MIVEDRTGAIYWPTEETMPAGSQNERLIPFAAKHVVVSGKVYTRNGNSAMVIEKITESPAK